MREEDMGEREGWRENDGEEEWRRRRFPVTIHRHAAEPRRRWWSFSVRQVSDDNEMLLLMRMIMNWCC
ncbi:hypothetical protein HanXRQr2_Chr01g0028941 [Helianthus annuus]|uniref:Uncharacterized protein n=1 Tax=Helianthus annuus TaxID=4232 RepID=A0A9K3JXZ7_HELAN|nr:hypothetical protein HanXRQr2_Chr01g0028941 [Helianthus annuus]KAJ0612096.1 hypothetical protein HanHA300_Chr01g0023321 [Helianthus annuus]KAJ0627450.1 hypothetical protein HanHA89_Chr01g0025511 [Helianthus annuus]KAJ0957501.1 hypothetical protein HanPSC8_Chr01g0028011 [Helianthus annuus]